MMIGADMLSNIDRISFCVYLYSYHLHIPFLYCVNSVISAEWQLADDHIYDQQSLFCWQCHSVFCSWAPRIAPSIQPCSSTIGYLTPPFFFSASRSHHQRYYRGCHSGHDERRYCELDCQPLVLCLYSGITTNMAVILKFITHNRIGFRRRANIISNQINPSNNNREIYIMEKYGSETEIK